MKLRNVAIIAHVDHGKTTLVDRPAAAIRHLPRQPARGERAMDSNDLERERGITILAKAASVQVEGHPHQHRRHPRPRRFRRRGRAHSQHGGRRLGAGGRRRGSVAPDKFVVSKALKVGLKPIVVINKVDRPDAGRPRSSTKCSILFAALDATEEQLDFPILLRIGQAGLDGG